MKYSVVAEVNDADIQKFRNIFDPKAHLIFPHITFVFPFEGTSVSDLRNHIGSISSSKVTFEVRFRGIEIADDGFIYLLVSEGKRESTDLHAALYTGMLKKYLRSDISYSPHLTVAQVSKNPDVLALKKLEKNIKCQQYSVSSLKLMAISNENKPRELIEEFTLLGTS